MSDYKELVRSLRSTLDITAAEAIEKLSAQLEAEETTNDRLRDEIAEAVGARERMAAEVERLNGYILAMHTDVVTPLRAEVERLRQELAEARSGQSGK